MPARAGDTRIGPMASAPRPRFGQIAVSRGFCTLKDVDRALRIQQEQDQRGEKHRLLGIIMTGEGILSTAQLIEILKAYDGKPPTGPA